MVLDLTLSNLDMYGDSNYVQWKFSFPDFFAYVSLGQTVYEGRNLAMD